MPFTTAQLATQINNNNANLQAWAATTWANQTGAQVLAFTTYFNNLQVWIANNGGANPFGYGNVAGLRRVANGAQVMLQGPQQRAPFNDAFDDVRAHLGAPGFRLFQAAQAHQRLVTFLGILN